MKLFRYQNFIKESKNYIHSICRDYGIEEYYTTINDDGTIDYDGFVFLASKGLSDLPLKFRNVNSFNCAVNQLTSLEGSPISVLGVFTCHINQLKNLEGAPREVGGDFSCHTNQLTSLEGSPNKVGGGFYCYGNKLLSLEGISKYISGEINCEYNKLRDVKGVKDGWRGQFHVVGNPVYQIFKLFPQERWDEVIEYLNEHEVIRDGKVVVLQALELVFHEMGLEVPEIDEIEGYQIQY